MTRTKIKTTSEAIYRAYEENQSPRLSNSVNPSKLGHECTRHLWYAFRWVTDPEVFDGRKLRLFETGQLEEQRLWKNLRDAGIVVYDKVKDPGSGQINAQLFGGLLNGYIDAAIKGIPEAPKTWHICEAKTHSNKNFNKVKKHGVKEAFYKHYVQMMIYMGIKEMKRGAYLAVNKDTDEIYFERIEFNEDEYAALLQKVERIIFDSTIPDKLSDNPDSFICKFCEFVDVCHHGVVPKMTCRSCIHVNFCKNGSVNCCKDKISKNKQLLGCKDHLYNPEFFGGVATAVDVSDNGIEYSDKINKPGGVVEKKEDLTKWLHSG